MTEKITPFSWFREFAPTFEKLPLRESGYERGKRFDREGAGITSTMHLYIRF